MKLYAVRVGRNPGIYENWSECQAQIKGFPGNEFKSFPTRQEALGYLGDVARVTGVAALNRVENVSMGSRTNKVIGRKRKIDETVDVTSPGIILQQILENPPIGTTIDQGTQILHVYCDGACPNIGDANAKAGIGVWFHYNDSRNVSEPIKGYATNIRAEMSALIKALQLTMLEERVIIYTDSKFTLEALLRWLPGWKRKGWKTATNKEVANQDLWKILEPLYHLRKQNVRFQFLYGHRSSIGNIEADKLATQGAERYQKIQVIEID